MEKWELNEIACVEYLNNHFGSLATFERQGGSDSTKADILCTTKTGKEIWIEAKSNNSQCGQFVLLPDMENRRFIYSSKNHTVLNEAALEIINHMNLFFDRFAKPGTKGVDLDDMDNTIFNKWIIIHYKEDLDVSFFISEDYEIFYTDDISSEFEVSATYRAKKSGSGNPAKSAYPDLEAAVKQLFGARGVLIDGNSMTVDVDIDLSDVYFEVKGRNYYIPKDGSKRIRKLSNTCNSNVIFSIKKVDSSKKISEEEFKKILQG